MSLRQIKLVLAYDGTAYAGWQFQPDQPTVQGVLQATLARVLKSETEVTGCGRTDAGVHALRYTASFFTEATFPPDAFRRALNTYLPDDITVIKALEASLDFHPINDIVRKRYRYVLYDGPVRQVFLQRYCWTRRWPLDEAAMRLAAQTLLGTHDFASFQSAGSPRMSTVRTVFDVGVQRWRAESPWTLAAPEPREAEAARAPHPFVILEIEADGFLYNMVRNVVGTLVEIGRGRRPAAWMREVLEARSRPAAGPTAPPFGLFMLDTRYRER